MRLNVQFEHQTQIPQVMLQALRHQVSGLLQGLERNLYLGEKLPQPRRISEPLFTTPVMILPARPMPEVPTASSQTRQRRIAKWLFTVAATIALVSGFLWRYWLADPDKRLVQLVQQEHRTPDSVRLDSLSLFDAGSSKLKPGSTKVLINALVNIKAQPGWLIVIVGPTTREMPSRIFNCPMPAPWPCVIGCSAWAIFPTVASPCRVPQVASRLAITTPLRGARPIVGWISSWCRRQVFVSRLLWRRRYRRGVIKCIAKVRA